MRNELDRTRTSQALLLAVSCMLSSWGAAAEDRGAPPPPPPPIEVILEENADRLGLDPAVSQQIEAISIESRQRGEVIRGRLHAAHDQMRALLSQENPEEEAVMRQADTIGELETEARKDRLLGMLRVRALLTPKQREELVRIHEERRAERPRRGRRGPPPHGPPDGHPPPPPGFPP
jgi:Spy/CpxP family protein refolding chaperone